ITRSALALPPKSRARLAETLLESLDNPDQKEIDALWATEAEDRIKAYESGKMQAFPGKEVFRALKARKRS
ncbi:MAG TPA: addiction module protein, partial [Verrucomicrobiae bacterium]|nr:addiction module protein [Verrucomicrobiae bacterium]